MATVSRSPIAPLHEKISVQLSKDDYLPAFDKALKGYAKNAQVPGFRKGAVPVGMIRKMYGPSLFSDEVLRQAGRQLEEYLKTERLPIFGSPMILPGEGTTRLDVANPADVDFHFEVGLKPEFTVPAIGSGQTLTHYNIAVSDAMLDDEVKRLTRRYGTVENPETVTAPDDILYISYSRDGAENVEDTELLDRLPADLQERFRNATAGTEITFRPSEVAEGEALQEFLTKTLKADEGAAGAEVRATLTKIGHLIPAELTPELFMQVFPNDLLATETQFRERLRAELGKEFERISAERLNNEMYETLVHSTPIELPAAFLKRWLREGDEKKPRSAAEAEKEYPGFEHGLRWTLISDQLLEQAGIEVSAEEVTGDIKGRVLAHFGMDSDEDAPWMEGYMQKVGKDEKMLNETYRRLLMDKLFAWLRTRFAVVEQDISEEEFFRLPDAHAAHHHGH